VTQAEIAAVFPAPRTTRARVTLVVAVVLGVVSVSGIVALELFHNTTGRMILIGDSLGRGQIGLILAFVATVSIAVTIALTLGRVALNNSRRLVRNLCGTATAIGVVATLGAGMLAGLVFLILSSAYTPVEGIDGRDDIVAVERGLLLLMRGDLCVRDGIVLECVATYSADDGFLPFVKGRYRVESQNADEAVLAYDIDSGGYWRTVTMPLGSPKG
jgi:hypothetical protein